MAAIDGREWWDTAMETETGLQGDIINMQRQRRHQQQIHRVRTAVGHISIHLVSCSGFYTKSLTVYSMLLSLKTDYFDSILLFQEVRGRPWSIFKTPAIYIYLYMEYLKIGGLWGFEDDTKKRILFVNWKGVWRPSCPAGVCIIHLWSNPWSERKTLFGFRFFCFQSQRQEHQQKQRQQRQQWQWRQCMIKTLDLSRKPCADSIFVVLWSEGQTKGETFNVWHFLQNNA